MRVLHVLLPWIIAAAASAASPGAGTPDPIAIAQEIEEEAARLAARIGAPDLGKFDGRAAVTGGSLSLRIHVVPELLAPLCERISRHPHLDFSQAELTYVHDPRTARVTDTGGRGHELSTGLMAIVVPVVTRSTHATVADTRAEAIRSLRRLVSSRRERLFAGEAWGLKELRMFPDGRLQFTALSASLPLLREGMDRLAGRRSKEPGEGAPRLAGLFVGQVNWEPFLGREVKAFGVEGRVEKVATAGPELDALGAALDLAAAWEQLPASPADADFMRMQSFRLVGRDADGRWTVHFDMSGTAEGLSRLADLLAAARLNASRGGLVVATVPPATLRVALSAQFQPGGRPPPPMHQGLLSQLAGNCTSADRLAAGPAPLAVRDLRIEVDGRVQLNGLARDLPSLAAALERLEGTAAAPVGRLVLQQAASTSFRKTRLLSFEIGGRVGDVPEGAGQRRRLETLARVAAEGGAVLQSLRFGSSTGSAVPVEIAASMAASSLPAFRAGLLRLDPSAEVRSGRGRGGSIDVVSQLQLTL